MYSEFLFISNLSQRITYTELYNYFKKFGHIKGLEFQLNKHNTEVILECSSIFMKEFILQSNHHLKGKSFQVHNYKNKEELFQYQTKISICRIHLKKLPSCLNSKLLYELFCKFGVIEKVYCSKLIKNGYKFGHILFEQPQSIELIPEKGVYYKKFLIKWNKNNKINIGKNLSKSKTHNLQFKTRNVNSLLRNLEIPSMQYQVSYNKFHGFQNKPEINENQLNSSILLDNLRNTNKSILQRKSNNKKQELNIIHHIKPTNKHYYSISRIFKYSSSNLRFNRFDINIKQKNLKLN